MNKHYTARNPTTLFQRPSTIIRNLVKGFKLTLVVLSISLVLPSNLSYAQSCNEQNLVFSNITQLVGTGNLNSIQEGDIYLLPDVGMQNGISFDATYEVITVDFNGGGSPSISSSTAISYTTTDAIQDDYVIIKITFIESGTATAGSPTGIPIDLNDFTFSIIDIESQFNVDLSEIGGVGNAQTSDNMPITYDNLLYAAGASTQVTVGNFINDGNEPNFTLIVTDPTFAGDPTDWVDETTTNTAVGRVNFEYNSLSSIEVLFGLTGSEGMVGRNLFLSASFCDIQVLPVELLFFTAEAVDNNAYLTWATATETNNAYFEVQQSTDGVNWTVISEVAGNGTTNTRHNYAYTHTNVSGVVFYRLKQVDDDGTASYSNIEVLNFASEALRLFPNPANDVLNITLGTGNNGRGAERIRDIVIYDMMGRVIQRINSGDSQSERIDISVLPPAMYMLGITTSDNTIRYEKFVKTNR